MDSNDSTSEESAMDNGDRPVVPRYDPMSLFRTYEIEHYCGDYVRQLFVASAVIAIGSIHWGYILPFGSTIEIACALLLVLLAGITSPLSSTALWYDTAVSGLGVLLLESAAINSYSVDSFFLFTAREVTAILLLFAFYFSVKTLRAHLDGRIGHSDTLKEIEAAHHQEQR